MLPTVSLTADNLPAGANFDSVAGIFDWVPTFDAAGDYLPKFTGTDDGDCLSGPTSSQRRSHIARWTESSSNAGTMLGE